MMIPWERWLLMLFAVMSAAGAVDYLAGNRRGLGGKFLEGLQTFTPLFLTMAGFLVLTPLLAKVLAPLVTPLFSAAGADPGLLESFVQTIRGRETNTSTFEQGMLSTAIGQAAELSRAENRVVFIKELLK